MALPNNQTQPPSDFDPGSIVRKVDDHDKGMELLSTRIKNIEDKFGSNEQIAETLCDTAKKAVKMQTMLADTFIELLKTNESVKISVTELTNKADRNATSLVLKRFGSSIIAIVYILLGSIMTGLIKHFFP